MTIRLAIIGVDAIQRDWTEAVRGLADVGAVKPVAVGHRSAAAARDLADLLQVPAFDDLRKLLVDTGPEMILMDRPENVSAEYLAGCLREGIGVFSLGPPVSGVAEARVLAEALEPRTTLLQVWPRMAGTRSYKHCAQADEFVRPVKFAAAQWYARNHALAKSAGQMEGSVRSLSVLAWDVLGTLIDLMGMPESVFASIRGAVGKGESFADLTGSAALTLRFPEGCTASVTVSDHIGPAQRMLLLLGQSGTLRLDEQRYHFSNMDGKLIDEGDSPAGGGAERAGEALREFIEQFEAAPSPHGGWEHRLEEIASTMEAMLVSHRTGQAELPERFLTLRR